MSTQIRSARETRMQSIGELADFQRGVLRRQQLRAAGWTRHHIEHEIGVGRWTQVASEVIALQNAPLTWDQRLWLGILYAGPGAVLSHRTACQLAGLTGWESDRIEVLVSKSRTLDPLPGFDFHESRRGYVAWVHPLRMPPQIRLETAALLAAERMSSIRSAIGLIAACVQQRLTTADRLFAASKDISKLRHGHELRLALWDIEGGSHSFAELDVARKCIALGLAPPTRQRIRKDSTGRQRYLDLEWVLADGRIIVLEIDGSFHLQTEDWWRDMRRQRRVSVGGTTVLRCCVSEARYEFWEVARDLLDHGIPVVSRAAA